MAAFSQISQNKRGRDEYLNSGLPSPDAKRSTNGRSGHDYNLMAFLDKIDSVDNIDTNTEDIHVTSVNVNDVEDEMELSLLINSLEDEIGLKTQTDNNIEPTDKNTSTEHMGTNKQGELSADENSEATSVTFDIGDFPYYDDFSGEYGLFPDHFISDEHGILQNHIYGYSTPDIMYPDTAQCYVETPEVFHGSLWEDDIWL